MHKYHRRHGQGCRTSCTCSAPPNSSVGASLEIGEMNKDLEVVVRISGTENQVRQSNINSRTARFDKHGERRKREELAVKQVHHNVEMDFSQYFKTELDKETFLFSSFVCSDLK